MKNEETKKYTYFKIYFILPFLIINIILINEKLFIYKFNEKTNLIDNNNTSIERIFLCTTYNNEAEIAYILFWRLYNYVYKFIVVVSNMTYSGLPKNVTFKNFKNDIEKYMDKIDIIYYDNICDNKSYYNFSKIWCFERTQRDYAQYYIEKKYNPTEKDLFIITDLDELLTREGIKYIVKNPPKDTYFLRGAIYFPNYYVRHQNWDRGLVKRYNKSMETFSRLRERRPHDKNTLRFKDDPSKPFITHCSYCFKDIEEYRNKIRSYGHQEYNKPPYITNNWLFKSHYCRERIKFNRYGIDQPYYDWKDLIPDDERLKYLIDPSFEFPLNQTNYTEKDLETLCSKKYNRKPFESAGKYKYK